MNEKVTAIARKVNKKLGAGTVLLGSEMLKKRLPRMTTGITSVDVMLGGGWVANQFIEVLGDESSGKTMLLYITIAANQKADPNWTCAWFAAEHFVAAYAEMWGCDLDRIIVINENTMEEVYEMSLDFLADRAVDCIVIDSLPALVASATEDADMEDVEVALEARINSRFLSKSGPHMRRSMIEEDRPVLFFIVNQWRERIGVRYGDPRTSPGGRKKNYVFFIRVEVKREEFITNTKGEPIGQVVRVRNIKNKTAPPGRRAVFDAYVADGAGFKAGEIDSIKDMVAVGLAYEVIWRPKTKTGSEGSTYMVAGQKIRGRDALVETLRSDPELQELLRKEIMQATETNVTVGRKVVRTSGRTTSGESQTGETDSETVGGTPTRRKRQRAVAAK